MKTSLTLHLSIALGALALSATLYESSAHACTPPQLRPGYVTALKAASVVVDDLASAVVCQSDKVNSCESRARYAGIQRALIISTTLSETPGAEGSSTFLPANNVTYVLKDAADAVIEQKMDNSNGVRFSKTGAKICVKTQAGPSDAGTGGEVDAGASTSEFCAPVAVADLLVTTADLDAKRARLLVECGTVTDGDSGTGSGDVILGIGDGGDGGVVAPAALTGTGGGGCAMSGSGGLQTALLMPVAALALARLRRRRTK